MGIHRQVSVVHAGLTVTTRVTRFHTLNFGCTVMATNLKVKRSHHSSTGIRPVSLKQRVGLSSGLKRDWPQSAEQTMVPSRYNSSTRAL